MSGCMQRKIEIKRKHCFTKMATTSNGNIHWLKWMAIKNDEWFEFMSHIDLHTIAFPQWRIITQKSIGSKNKKIYRKKKYQKYSPRCGTMFMMGISHKMTAITKNAHIFTLSCCYVYTNKKKEHGKYLCNGNRRSLIGC